MWNYNSPHKILFGEGVVSKLPTLLEEAGYERVVLFSRNPARLSETARRAVEAAGERIVERIEGIAPEPDTRDIAATAEKLRNIPFDAAVAIGGGSVIDTAKAVSAVCANGCGIEDLAEGRTGFHAAIPLIAVPTTSGTGSEVTRAAALTHNGNKQPIFDDTLYPAISLIDPELTYSCPASVTASCGLDVLSHAAESLMHRQANPVSESLAKEAIRRCFAGLERCCADPGDREARRFMSEASMLAGMAIAASGCTASHACSYLLSSQYRIPHGEACAFTLDKLIRLCLRHDGRFHAVASELGMADGWALADRVENLKAAVGLRKTLTEMGIPKEDRERLIEAGYASKVLKNHYFEITKADVETLFEE